MSKNLTNVKEIEKGVIIIGMDKGWCCRWFGARTCKNKKQPKTNKQTNKNSWNPIPHLKAKQ
jgi:hypothetical protein